MNKAQITIVDSAVSLLEKSLEKDITAEEADELVLTAANMIIALGITNRPTDKTL